MLSEPIASQSDLKMLGMVALQALSMGRDLARVEVRLAEVEKQVKALGLHKR